MSSLFKWNWFGDCCGWRSGGWTMKYASHCYAGQWIPSAKNSIPWCWNQCTVTASITLTDTNLQPLNTFLWRGKHDMHMLKYLGYMLDGTTHSNTWTAVYVKQCRTNHEDGYCCVNQYHFLEDGFFMMVWLS